MVTMQIYHTLSELIKLEFNGYFLKMPKTSFEQIMAYGFEVKYIQSAIRIRCVVDKTHLQMNYLMKLEISQTHLCKYNTGLWRIF